MQNSSLVEDSVVGTEAHDEVEVACCIEMELGKADVGFRGIGTDTVSDHRAVGAALQADAVVSGSGDDVIQDAGASGVEHESALHLGRGLVSPLAVPESCLAPSDGKSRSTELFAKYQSAPRPQRRLEHYPGTARATCLRLPQSPLKAPARFTIHGPFQIAPMDCSDKLPTASEGDHAPQQSATLWSQLITMAFHGHSQSKIFSPLAKSSKRAFPSRVLRYGSSTYVSSLGSHSAIRWWTRYCNSSVPIV